MTCLVAFLLVFQMTIFGEGALKITSFECEELTGTACETKYQPNAKVYGEKNHILPRFDDEMECFVASSRPQTDNEQVKNQWQMVDMFSLRSDVSVTRCKLYVALRDQFI